MLYRMGIWLRSLTKGEKPTSPAPSGPREVFHSHVEENESLIINAFGNSSDVLVRHLILGSQHIALVHIDGLVDRDLLTKAVLEPLASACRKWDLSNPQKAYDTIKERLLATCEVKETRDLRDALRHLGDGEFILFMDGIHQALVCDVRGWESRSIQEPINEATIRGPKDAFTETLRTNTVLIRRRIKDARLRVEEMSIGRVTQTTVAVLYIKGIAKEEIVGEVRERLKRIDVDGILESGYLEEYIEDNPYSPFPQVLRTERPDRVAGSLLEGRIAILTDGTPFALIAPATFMQLLSSSEDYYGRYVIGSFVRWIRFAALFISLTLPSLYIAVTTFHQELLPTGLILTIAGQREGIPFPAFVEALLIEVVFEILREAGVRLPRLMASAATIVGTLVIGQVAVLAGLVSPFMVIVVALTAIASFTIPVPSLAITMRLARFVMIALAASLGLFGIILGLSGLFIHLSALRSFGIPYFAPLSPLIPGDLKDTLIRAPLWALDTRPSLVTEHDRRQKPGLKPRPPQEEGDPR